MKRRDFIKALGVVPLFSLPIKVKKYPSRLTYWFSEQTTKFLYLKVSNSDGTNKIMNIIGVKDIKQFLKSAAPYDYMIKNANKKEIGFVYLVKDYEKEIMQKVISEKLNEY